MVRKAATPIHHTLQRRERLLQLINPRHKLRSLLVVISPVGPAASHLVLMVLFSLTTRPSIVLESRMEKHGVFLIYNIFGIKSTGEVMLQGFGVSGLSSGFMLSLVLFDSLTGWFRMLY